MVDAAMSEPCPNAETLAAYGDGKLSPAERREVEKHLAACEDCFELFAGSAAFRLGDAESSPVIELSQRQRAPRRWWRAAVAAAVVATGVWVLVPRQLGKPTAPAEVLAFAERLGGTDELRDAAAHSWRGGVGVGFSGPSGAKRAFRLGVHLFDARVALVAHDADHWLTALDEANLLVASGSESARILDGLRGGDGARGGSAANRKDLDQLVRLVREPAPEAFDFGAWAEAGRLAALGGRGTFLNSEIARRIDTASRAAGDDPLLAREIATIRGALGDRQVSAAELSALERSFRQIILLQ
jgi:hypothetical protein